MRVMAGWYSWALQLAMKHSNMVCEREMAKSVRVTINQNKESMEGKLTWSS